MRSFVIGAPALLGAVLALNATAADLPGTPDCTVPPELVQDEPRLPGLAERLHDKQPITIVAIGGASTAGNAAGNAAESAYPHRLQDEMQRRHPGVSIVVHNKGVSRDTTQEMVNRFPRDVFALSPNLVIWETGTFDAARSIDVDVFAGALESGLAELRERNLEIILVDMQYSRSTASVISFEPYLATMEHMADVDGIYLFRRFEIMKYWSESGVFNFGDVPQDRRQQLARDVYQCLAERLADAIDYATR